MSGEQEEAEGRGVPLDLQNFRNRDRVSPGLRHLLAVSDEVMAVQPVVDEFFSGVCFRLGDLVLVMGKNVVYTAAVDIERFAQVLGAHGRAFDVTSRPAGADIGLPERLSLFFRLPQ